MSSFLRVIGVSAAIVVATVAFVVLVDRFSSHDSREDQVARVQDREPRHVRVRREPSVGLPSVPLDLGRRPSVLWTLRRHRAFAHALANVELDPGSGPSGVAPFNVSIVGGVLVWNSTLRTYLIDIRAGHQTELAGCGDVNVGDTANEDLLVSACGRTRRVRLVGTDLQTRWCGTFDGIEERAGEFALASSIDREDNVVIDLRSGEIVHRFDSERVEAATVDSRGRVAIANGIYAKGDQEWDLPKRVRLRVIRRSGEVEWERSLDINPNGLGLSLDGDTLTVHNWDLGGRERVIDVKERGSPRVARVGDAGDVFDTRGGYTIFRRFVDGTLTIVDPRGASVAVGAPSSTEWSAARIVHDVVLLADEHSLRAYRLRTGRPVWTVQLPAFANEATAERVILVADQAIFVAGPSALIAIGDRRSVPRM